MPIATELIACQQCGAVTAHTRQQMKGYSKHYCSTKCRLQGLQQENAKNRIARFWAKVDKTPGLGPGGTCWEWKGSVHPVAGYGATTLKCRGIGTHRMSWLLCRGEIPSDLWVLHRCENPPCVNPDHLFLGTGGDNVRDMVAKGRQITRQIAGVLNPKAKLTWEMVRTIRARAAAGEIGYRLAKEYGVSTAPIYRIIKGLNWKESGDSERQGKGQSATAA